MYSCQYSYHFATACYFQPFHFSSTLLTYSLQRYTANNRTISALCILMFGGSDVGMMLLLGKCTVQVDDIEHPYIRLVSVLCNRQGRTAIPTLLFLFEKLFLRSFRSFLLYKRSCTSIIIVFPFVSVGLKMCFSADICGWIRELFAQVEGLATDC